ncbi:hypothetical protein [Kamptonema formosum]|uniref:hypothetical protein n=1 Tax=Kamptonema formosum TaxID=331992 RepID=UPI0012DE75E8|nr:hypothetical protein [Oscillatoria sp. PCC 10802]
MSAGENRHCEYLTRHKVNIEMPVRTSPSKPLSLSAKRRQKTPDRHPACPNPKSVGPASPLSQQGLKPNYELLG